MNILYCGDGNIADGVIISALSLAERVSEPLSIYILTASLKTGSTVREALSESFRTSLEEFLKERNKKNMVKLIDITKIFNENLPLANLQTRFTPFCMLRLYADLISDLPDKILYLDNDVICRKNPNEFYNQDIENFEIAGCLDYYGSWFFKKNPFKRDYLNSGVLLLNLKRIRETGLFLKCRRHCCENQMFMPDQTALNKLSQHKKICKRCFNEQRKLRKDTVFQHFTTSFRFFPYFHTVSVKPWNIDAMHKILNLYEYDEILKEYLNFKENEYAKTK